MKTFSSPCEYGYREGDIYVRLSESLISESLISIVHRHV